MPLKTIQIDILYATPDTQIKIPLRVNPGTTIDLAIKQSGILVRCSELVLEDLRVGIWGEAKRLSDVLKAGDRVEIYRPLLCDPKEARRRRTILSSRTSLTCHPERSRGIS